MSNGDPHKQRDTSILPRVEEMVRASEREVFLLDDFHDLGETEQVVRAIDQLITREIVASIGEGLYAKTRKNVINGRQMLSAEGGFDQVAKEGLNRLGISWKCGSAEEAYQRGGSQIPANTFVRIEGNPDVEIAFGDFRLNVEPWS